MLDAKLVGWNKKILEAKKQFSIKRMVRSTTTGMGTTGQHGRRNGGQGGLDFENFSKKRFYS